MTRSAFADSGGQAAIRDITNNNSSTAINGLIGQLTGSGNVVIQHLHINTSGAPLNEGAYPSGLIAHFGLSQWWLTGLAPEDRAEIEDSFGAEVAKSRVSRTSRTPQSWLHSLALRVSASHPTIASKLRAKATEIETGVPIDDYWLRQLDVVNKHWLRLDFEQARVDLREIAYRMREENALPEARAAYDKLLKEFLHADPYYAEVIAVVLPIIANRPGVIQSFLAKELNFDVERFRYAMYYGDITGEIRRVKSGRSYALYPMASATA